MTIASYFSRKIVTIKFGSHLYGTDTPKSDLDIKSVFIPCATDILLQRVKGSVGTRRTKAEGEKNVAGELDEESYSLQRFLGLAAEGQTVALDVLFSPESAMIEKPADEWIEVIANRHRLITKRSAAFVGYCRQQANKYGIKGSRVSAARKALTMLTTYLEVYGTTAKLEMAGSAIREVAGFTEHMAILEIAQVSGATIPHWEVCGRKMSFTASIEHAHGVVQRLVSEYGHRALQAERQEGVDWKALSHAVRVGRQAIELFTTGHVTFPLPYAARIKAIKAGELSYQEVSGEIERLLAEVETEALRSTLPDDPDTDWIDQFVAHVHRKEVCSGVV